MSERRLLILDDDAMVAQIVAFVAEDMGLEASVVTTAAGLFDEIERAEPSHIVLDLVMPDVDGVEVLRRLAERGCRARIVIVSGLGTAALEEVRDGALALGLDVIGALTKPFRPAQIHALLEDGPARQR